MAKKKNAKQLREEQKNLQKAKWQEKAQQSSKAVDKGTETVNSSVVPATKVTPVIKTKKTKAKIAGMKSIFTVGNQLYTTSFGKGNDANLETRIEEEVVTSLNKCPKYDVDKKNCDLTINGRNNVNAKVLVEKETKVHLDQLCLKETLEKEIFGKSFDDTLHVQIAYNIVDIQKIIALYATQAVYSLDNVFRYTKEEYTDLMGMLGTRTYEEFMNYDPKVENNNPNAHDYRVDLDKFTNSPLLRYYGDVFVKFSDEETLERMRLCKEEKRYKENLNKETDEEKKQQIKDKLKEIQENLEQNSKTDDDIENFKKKVYDIIALLGQLRQWSFHSLNNEYRYWAYELDSLLKDEFKGTLNNAIDSKIRKINKKFIDTNKVNLSALRNLIDEDISDSEMVEMYYNFIVRKQQKNLGFSVKKLREIALKGTVAMEKSYDSVRAKLYKLVDFLIFYNYVKLEQDQVEKMVDSLRKTTNEEEKEEIYQNESQRIWNRLLKKKLNEILNSVSGKAIKSVKKFETDEDVETIIKEISIMPTDISYFSKLMYLLSCFIDGKEINDLLTTLINKFDNIRSFVDTAKDMKLDCKFSGKYQFFKNSSDFVEEINIIKSIARMEKPSPEAKKIMYTDACDILGYEPGSKDEYDKLFFKDENGELRKAKNHDFRNFICNNVVENDRFKYLIKYSNAKKVRLLAKNEIVVKFVLNQLPEEQIQRYFDSCGVVSKTKLVELILNMDKQFDRFKNVPQKSKAEENVEKQQCQAIISLYLTVLYLLVKNLVNINSRYVTGFYFVERDARLYNVSLKDANSSNDKAKDFRNLTKYMLDDQHDNAKRFREKGYFKTKKYRNLAEINYNNSGSKMCTDFRNSVDHLNAVRNANLYINDIKYIDSYYDLYQYLIQKSVAKKNSDIKYAKDLEEYKTYSKDFTKALCVPFAYNTPRFKNLSIDVLFDKNK